MKQPTFEQLMIASVPEQYNAMDDDFTDRIMKTIKSSSLAVYVAQQATPKKKPLQYSFRHLSSFAMIAIALGAILTITGTAYAITQLWPKPVVHMGVPMKTATGRINAVASLENCGNQAAQQTIQVKKMSTIDPADIQKILQARCEMSAIQQSLAPQDLTRIMTPPKDGEIREITGLYNASTVLSINKTTLQLSDTNAQNKLTLTPDTKYVVNNQETAEGDIHPGDVVDYVLHSTFREHLIATSDPNWTKTSTDVLDEKVLYVIKLDLPLVYYSAEKQNQIEQINTCNGNTQDSCMRSGIVDLYQDNGLNPLGTEIESGRATTRDIQLTLTSINSSRLTGTSTSGRVFAVTLPIDAIKLFNTTQSHGYNNVVIGIGDTILIRYYELSTEHSTTIASSNVEHAGLLVETIQKNDPVQKY